MMKKIYLTTFPGLLMALISMAQEPENNEKFVPSGSAFGRVYLNYHYDLSADQKSAFEIQRSYLGYAYKFSEAISGKITFDGSRKSDAGPFTVVLKHAQLDWKLAEPVKITVGLMGLTQFSDQEKFWGYRYIYKTFQDEFAFGSSADLGVNAAIKARDKLRLDVFMLNGDGYTRIQDAYGMHKYGADVVAEPLDGLLLKAYYSANFNKYDKYNNDSVIADTSTIQNLAFFMGYKRERFRIGAEYNLMLDGTGFSAPAQDHQLSGLAVYATYAISKKFEVFGNYFYLTSNTPAGSTGAWNISEDGNLVLVGIQYSPVKGVKAALNYRNYIYSHPPEQDLSRIYLNFEFGF
jgi:hypothetical protein